jgi:protease I
MADDLKGMKVAILATDGVERIELEELVIDGQFTSSRSPADLPAFCPAIVAQFAKASVPG